MTKENSTNIHKEEMTSSEKENTTSEKENTTKEEAMTSDEIHTTAHKKAVAEGKISENETMEEKTSFWQSRKFQWILWIVGVLVIAGIVLFQKINTLPVAINPTQTPITFEIDGRSYTIKSNGYQEIKLSRGEHIVTMNGQEVGKFINGWLDGDAIINPTKEAFVQLDIPYTTPGKENACDSKLKNNTITLGEDKYEGSFEYIEPALYVKKTWDFAPWEGSVSTLRTKTRSDCVIKKELYTIDSFKREMQ